MIEAAGMTDLSTAQCPNHRYGQVTFTCVRCGTFGCNACRSPMAGPLCSACGARASAMGLPVLETLQESFQFLLRRRQLLLAVVGFHALFALLLQFMARRPLVLVGVALFVSSVVEIFLVRYVGDQLDDPESTMEDSLREAFARLLPSLGSNLLVGIAVFLGLMACIVPGLFLLVGLCLAIPAVVLHDAGVIESLSVSWGRTEEHRWPLLGLIALWSAISAGMGMVGGIFQLLLGLLGQVGVTLGHMVGQSISGLSLCLFTTLITISYLKLSGQYTGERQGG